MNFFSVEYYDACLFASGLAAAAVCHFAGARRMMVAASAPLLLATLALALGRGTKAAEDFVAVVVGFSMLAGSTAFVLSLACHPGEERRRAWAATFLLSSPALPVLFAALF